jgi:hypothetical protein
LTLAATGALAGLAAGCPPSFDGPYPCQSGFASCTNPQENKCETDVTIDALNCGMCGNACPVGGACMGTACGPTAALQLATLGQSQSQQETLLVNDTAVFWYGSLNGESGVVSVPIAGGTPTIVATDLMCEGPNAFAVDDNNLYYVSNGSGAGSGQGGPGNDVGLVEVPLAGGLSPTVLIANSNGGVGCPVLAVDATNVYALTQIAQAARRPRGPGRPATARACSSLRRPMPSCRSRTTTALTRTRPSPSREVPPCRFP